LTAVGVDVTVLMTPWYRYSDSIFPNNWISFHENGDSLIPNVCWESPSRTSWRYIRSVEDKGFVINNIVDYTSAEEDGFFLEGTEVCS
jgi:hypothetical protein